MLFKKNTIALISVILIGLLLNSCSANVNRRISPDTPQSLDGRLLHIIWDKNGPKDIYMTQGTVRDKNLTGQIAILPKFKPNILDKYLGDVYVDPSIVPPDSSGGKLSIPTSQINRIELYEYNPDQGIGRTIVFFTFVAAAIVIAIISAQPKKHHEDNTPPPPDTTFGGGGFSCPFIYPNNGNEFEFTGEIYSGAILKNLERNDYLPLPNLKPVNNQYQIKMTNEIEEIQSTNLAELLVVDHQPGTEVLIDRYGKYQTIAKLQKPKSAYSANKRDILPLVKNKDSLKFTGDISTDKKLSTDSFILSFDLPDKAKTAKLILHAKNSFWLDYTISQLFQQFGSTYNNFYKNQQKTPGALLTNWELQQGIPLSVYLKQNGEWIFVDYFDVVGPMANKDLVMPIDVSKINSDAIELKLECGSFFWEVDYAAIDFSPRQIVHQQIITLSEAINEKGQNVKELLNKDDNNYYVMPDIGNQSLMKFDVPKVLEGNNRSVFLHSKGHYELMVDAKGIPDLSYLKVLQEPGALGQFSRERYLELKR